MKIQKFFIFALKILFKERCSGYSYQRIALYEIINIYFSGSFERRVD